MGGGTCMCLNGYTGNDCSDIIVKCPKQCSGHGVCHEADLSARKPARCECALGWTGPDCANFPLGVDMPAPVIGDSSNSLAAQENNAAAQANQGVDSAVNPATAVQDASQMQNST